LVLANVAFFGWAHWIDVPQAAQAVASAPALPLLALAGSGPTSAAAAAGVPAQPGPAAASTAAQGPPSAPGGPGQAANGGQARCRSLGPFTDAAGARAVADELRVRKLAPRDRTVGITLAGGTVNAYWLDIDLAAGEPDPPLAALRGRPGSAAAAAAVRGAAFSDCPTVSAGG
jgi:hypothetical protein